MRKPVAQEFEDDMAEDMLDAVYEALSNGAQGSGTTLSKGDCALLLKQLPQRGLFASVLTNGRWKDMADYSRRQQLPTEAAVTATAQYFGVSRATVYAALHRYDEYEEFLRQKSV